MPREGQPGRRDRGGDTRLAPDLPASALRVQAVERGREKTEGERERGERERERGRGERERERERGGGGRERGRREETLG